MASHPRSKAPAVVEPYHHGALRDALLAATEAILEEQGLEAFSLRECARRAGVSHAAPAHHFGDARGLLTAYAALGFERMAQRMGRYRKHAADEPAAQLIAVGQAYIDFALAHRAQFQLMNRRDRLERSDPALQAAGGRARAMLAETLTAAMRAAGLPPHTTAQRAVLAWSAVHGFAMLALEGVLDAPFGLPPGDNRAAGSLAAAMLRVLEPSLSGRPPAIG